MSRDYPKYDDGLDDDGYVLPPNPWRKPYIHGDESEAADWEPRSIGEAVVSLFEREARRSEIGRNCESPIELEMGAAILLFFERAGRPLKICLTIDLVDAPDELLLVPQFAWSYYRSDWAILNPRRTGALLIECDGREFHSSPEQMMHDTKKDTAAADRGFLTLRFTGSQIHRDADACAQKIFDAVHG